MLPRISATEREKLETEDWQRDSARRSGGPLGWMEFADAVFALVDVWTKGISKRQYVAFLVNTIKALKSSGPRSKAKSTSGTRGEKGQLRHTHSSTAASHGGRRDSAASLSRSSTAAPGRATMGGFGTIAAARKVARKLMRKITVGRFDFKVANRPGLPVGFGREGGGEGGRGPPSAAVGGGRGLSRSQAAKNRAERMLQRAMAAVETTAGPGGLSRSRGSQASSRHQGSAAALVGSELQLGRSMGQAAAKPFSTSTQRRHPNRGTGGRPVPPKTADSNGRPGFGTSRRRRLQLTARAQPRQSEGAPPPRSR